MHQERPAMGSIQLPPVTPTVRWVLIALFVLYALELSLRNAAGLPVDALAWFAPGERFALWQPATRFLVQGQAVLTIVLQGVVIYFFLPTLERLFDRRQILEALLAGAVGGTVFGFLVGFLGLADGAAYGWAPAVTVLVALFGLKLPDQSILLFFVLPVPGKVFVWGTGLLALLYYLATLSLGAADHLGTWFGVLLWWRYLGPGARTRRLREHADRIQREIEHLHVLDGGKGRGGNDDLVH